MLLARSTEWTQEIENQALEYINNYESCDHAFPSIVGLSSVIGRARSTIYKWADDDIGKFSDILEEINEKQELVAWNKGLKGDYNANLVKLLLGKHGYHDKSEVDSKVSVFAQVSDELDDDEWEEQHS